MQIKPAKISDKENIYKIHTIAVRETCKNFYTQKQIEAWLKNKSPESYIEAIEKNEMFIAEENNQIIGFCHVIAWEIVAIFVDPKSHKKGVGKMLLQYAMEIAWKNKKVIKIESTLNAESFYKKYGFVKTKESSVIRQWIEIPIIIMEYSN